MALDVTIRPERPGDAQRVHDLTHAAFAPMAFSDGTEAAAVEAMRQSGDLVLSLVAETDRIIGHIAFSPATISGAKGDWFALGPISVDAGHQRRGIGTALAKAGLAALKAQGAAGCVLTGNPDVYRSMGFRRGEGLSYGGLNPKFILYHAFDGTEPAGEITFAPALQEDHP